MERLAERKIEYALFCGDGVYNMNLGEAAECAEIVGASNNILYHMVADGKALFDRAIADNWPAPNKLIVEAGEEIELFPSDLEKEVRRLKRLNKQLDNKTIIKNKQIEVLQRILYHPSNSDLRADIFSLADEFAIIQDEADVRRLERKRKKHEEIFEETGEVTPLVAEMLDGEVAVLGANIPGLVTRWYKKKADSPDKFDEKIYVSVSEKLAEILDAYNREEYNAEQRHTAHLDIGASEKLTDEPDRFDEEHGFADFGGNPIITLIREEQERIRQLTLLFREKELAEIKAIITAKLPPSQALYYYYSKYEGLPNTKIAELCGVSKQNVGDKLKLAKIKAFQLCLDKLQPSEALRDWYRAEKERLRFYTK
jgi:DNA-directed RNA polymerase specialized sigma24 family protein